MRSVEHDLQETDRASLALVEFIKSRFLETTTVVGPVGNVYAVFFHDLILHFSGILIHRIAQESYQDSVRFPQVNKDYALSPYSINSQDLTPSSSRRTMKTLVRELPLSRAAIGEALPFGDGQDRLASRIINLMGSFKPFVRAQLPKKREQIDSLLDAVDEMCRLHEIPQRDVVKKNWFRYAECHTTENQDRLKERGVILGTRNNLQNRKLAVNYLQQDKEVVAITHGEVSNSVMDEPPFGYSERTLCTTLIDYGDFDEDGYYNKALMNPTQKFYRSAPAVVGQYRRSNRIRRPDPDRCRTLYIPTTYSGNDLYGPFHIYEDAVYRQWQSVLFEALPGLIMKIHPKSKSKACVPDAFIEHRQLEECIADYDLLVFDYFATGAVLAIISDKPVIYFDIGLRRLAPKFAADLRNRCEYAKINFSSDMRRQCADAMEKFWSGDREWSNSKILRYSLCEEEHFHWSGLLKAVSTGSPPSW